MGNFRVDVKEKPHICISSQKRNQDFDNAFSFLERDATREYNGQYMKSCSYLEDVDIDWDA